MTSDTYLALVADILGLASRLQSGETDGAAQYVERSFQGRDRARLLSILTELRHLGQEQVSLQRAPNDQQIALPPISNDSTNAPELRELKAILLDEQFLPSKRALLEFSRRYLKQEPTTRIEKKASRSEIATWMLNALSKEPVAVRKTVYQGVRKAYLRQRDSDLSGWAQIISGNTK